ncbi:AmpG family muropeptide MFS transporter [Emcibacter sp.]|uniref:AmpG family muropeptide MFS transporter n=1 Tax=Emcibacter sp. TaxID=1979954 RepID=UPI002AA884EF|nr:MFS transporter [Emcibacter sp.]
MSTSIPEKKSWWDAIEIYRRPRLIGIFGMGISSGFPLTLVLSTLGYWLSQEGVDAETIGLLAVVTMPYSLKFLWSPLIDWIKLPLMHKSFGRRRSWLFLIQAGLTAAVLFLGSTNPKEGAMLVGLGALLVSFMSASQDIVLDAYRIEILTDEEQPAGAAMIQFGYRIGNYISGTGGLALAALYDWHVAYYVLSLQVLCGVLPALLLGEPKRDGHELVEQETEAVEHWLKDEVHAPTALSLFVENFYLSVIVPFKEFMSRHGWMLILLFIILLKIGDGMASVMTPVLLVDLGFSNAEIIYANKTVGAIALLIGIFVGGLLLKWTGTYRGLFIAAVLMMVSNLSFAVLNEVGYNVPLLAFTMGFENFASGLGGTLAIAYLSGLCNLAYTATQYALLSSLASVGRGVLAAPSGFGYAEWGPTAFFIFTTIAAIPAIILLFWMRKLGTVSEDLRVKS